MENLKGRLAWSDSSCGSILTSADFLEHVVAENTFHVFFFFIKTTQCHCDTDYIGHMIVIMFKMLKNCLKFGIIFELHVVSQSSLVMVDDPTCTEPTRPMINKGDNPGQTTLMIPLALVTLVRSSSRCSCGEVEGPAGGLALSWDLSQKSVGVFRYPK